MSKDELEVIDGIILSKFKVESDDVILMTVDRDTFALDEIEQMFQMLVRTFPEHTILITLKGIEINKLREKEI